jgi:DNA recombination protein Rad52
MRTWDEITPLLEAKLDRAHVKPPPQGKYGSYIEGWHVIAEANRIFGFEGWLYKIDSLELAHKELVTLQGRDGPYDQWRATYVCTVTVKVRAESDGALVFTERQDVGCGHGQGKPIALGDVLESAAKEAVTDALKRALRTFGNPFGLALYDKSGDGIEEPARPANKRPEQAQASGPPLSQQAAPAGPREEINDETAEAIILAINARKSKAELDQYEDALRKSPKPHAAVDTRVRAAFAKRRSELDPIAYGEHRLDEGAPA